MYMRLAIYFMRVYIYIYGFEWEDNGNRGFNGIIRGHKGISKACNEENPMEDLFPKVTEMQRFICSSSFLKELYFGLLTGNYWNLWE